MTKFHRPQDPAASIIAACGGVDVVSSELPAHFTRVYEWRRTGRIPSRHWPKLIEMASARGASVKADDFLAEPAPASETAA
jgi:hypothetical protein